MKRTRLLGATAALALLVGCSMARVMGEPACTAANCPANGPAEVTVTVDGSGKCSLSAQDQIHVAKNNKPNIIWKLKQPSPPQFAFAPAPGGIQFNKSPMPPSTEFSGHSINGNGNYQVKDNNSRTGTWHYKINVVKRSDGSAACSLDPVIANDGCDGCP